MVERLSILDGAMGQGRLQSLVSMGWRWQLDGI
jgi:hypothetical protein